MAAGIPTAAVTDFGQYAELRALAREQSPEALRRTAEQFEAVFTQMLLKSMRDANLGEDILGGSGGEFYRDLFDQQIAANMAGSGRGLGIADMLVRQLQLGQQPQAPAEMEAAQPASFMPALRLEVGLSARADPVLDQTPAVPDTAPIPEPPVAAGAPPVAVTPAPAAPRDDTVWEPGSPAEFVTQLLPHAESAARKLGVSAHVLVAQAALETGWGRHLMRNADGCASFNFFGIKADNRWEGAAVRHSTLEFEDGQMNRVNASFRSYASMAEAFDDYANFLESNPRYAQALRHGGDEARFVNGLQNAGYATDPAYAQKVLRIAGGETLQAALLST